MSFRKQPRDHKEMTRQQAWIDKHRETLRSLGIFPVAYVDYDHWSDFLETGELHFHPDPSRFTFEKLTKDQQRALLRFLEKEYGQNEKTLPLLGWLRVRFPSNG